MRPRNPAGIIALYMAHAEMIDMGSAYAWAEIHVMPHNPAIRHASALVLRVARDLKRFGWNLQAVLSGNGGEFRSHAFRDTVASLGAEQSFIHPGRPQTNGCVERLQGSILEECWKPAFARYLVKGHEGLPRDLRRYLLYQNHDRAHTGRWTQDRTPAEVIGATKMYSGR